MPSAPLNASSSSDPLLEQSSHNKFTDHAPKNSGSAPSSDAETPAADREEKNIIETKLEQAFDKAGHDKEVCGAGVGRHPPA